MYSASAELTPIGIGGRFKQTIVSSSTVNVGSGLTIKSISSVTIQLVFNGFSTVTITLCVFVLNGFGSSVDVMVLPFSSV